MADSLPFSCKIVSKYCLGRCKFIYWILKLYKVFIKNWTLGIQNLVVCKNVAAPCLQFFDDFQEMPHQNIFWAINDWFWCRLFGLMYLGHQKLAIFSDKKTYVGQRPLFSTHISFHFPFNISCVFQNCVRLEHTLDEMKTNHLQSESAILDFKKTLGSDRIRALWLVKY